MQNSQCLQRRFTLGVGHGICFPYCIAENIRIKKILWLCLKLKISWFKCNSFLAKLGTGSDEAFRHQFCLWHKQQNMLHPSYSRITRKWIHLKMMILVSLSWIRSPSICSRFDIENDGDCELCNSSSNTEAVEGLTEIGSFPGIHVCLCVCDCVCVSVRMHMCVCVCCVHVCIYMCRAYSISPSDG